MVVFFLHFKFQIGMYANSIFLFKNLKIGLVLIFLKKNRGTFLIFTSFIIFSIISSCINSVKPTPLPIIGTWQLIAATATEKDSTYSTFNPKVKMIKIINPTHFAFLSHLTSADKDTSSNEFSAGGGSYTLSDSVYIENLEYFSDRKWENNKFQFSLKISGDTLIQKGVEKLEKLGIDRVILEKYKRL